jgi:competence transcription factor ComK
MSGLPQSITLQVIFLTFNHKEEEKFYKFSTCTKSFSNTLSPEIGAELNEWLSQVNRGKLVANTVDKNQYRNTRSLMNEGGFHHNSSDKHALHLKKNSTELA